MTEPALPGTRERVLTEARELFIDRGYSRTSLRLIADRLGLSKAAVLYHFPSKEELLVALAKPLLVELEAVVEAAGRLPPERARWALLEGWLATMVAHRRSLRMFERDLTFLSAGEIYQRFLSVGARAQAVVAGPDPDLAERVRAVQAVGMLGDPLIYMRDVPSRQLTEIMLDGVRRLLEQGPADAAPPGGPGRAASAEARTGEPVVRRPYGTARGRPSVMTPGRQAAVERLLAAGEMSPTEIARALGVSRATVYRYLTAREEAASEPLSETI
jgi:AcrR family transcriptional regulator